MLSRRTFLATAAVAAAERTPSEIGVETFSQTPAAFCGWPTAALRRNGEIVVVYSGGREAHVCPFGRVEIMRSSDSGATWSYPRVLMDSPIDDRDAGVCETAAGTLLVTTFTSLAYQAVLDKARDWPAERLARWQAVNRRCSESERRALLGEWMFRSEDGGLTWSAPYRVPLNSPHGPAPLRSGRLIYAGKQLWDTNQKAVVYDSTDDGRTWRWLADVPVREGDAVQQYHELHAVECSSGKLILQIRNHNPTNAQETLQCESSDGGKTWTTPHPIGVWGLPSHLLRLRDGRLLMTYGYRREPRGNLARLSADEGVTWSDPIRLSSGAIGDLGYPSTVELADGRLLTVWYEVMAQSPLSVLRLARWRA